MTVLDIDEFKSHTGGAFHSIFVVAGRAKTAVAAERNKLNINIFHLSLSGTKRIFNFFIMVCKDFL